MESLLGFTIYELQELLKKKEISSVDLVRAHLKKSGDVEDKIKALLTITAEEALAQAQRVDEQRIRGEQLSPLAGIPFVLSDNICTKGIRTTAASKMLADFLPPYNATVVEKLAAAGAVLCGKANLDEFGLGTSTESSFFGGTRNPHDLKAVPGGACGGAAASVAANEVVFALGSDTGGDLRQPASFCGVVGFKPTYGLVSRAGVIATASSLDQVGCLTRDIKDCALILNSIVGDDPLDSTSLPGEGVDFTPFLSGDLRGLKIGIPRTDVSDIDTPEITTAWQTSWAKAEELGAECVEVTLPEREMTMVAYDTILSAEASSNLARLDGIRYGFRATGDDLETLFQQTRGLGFGSVVKKTIIWGTYVLGAKQYEDYYVKALRVRNLLKTELEKVWQKVNCLLLPTTSTTAFDRAAEDEKTNLTCLANLTGIPALSLPWGTAAGRPLGLQLLAPAFAEKTLLKVAAILMQNTASIKSEPKGKGGMA